MNLGNITRFLIMMRWIGIIFCRFELIPRRRGGSHGQNEQSEKKGPGVRSLMRARVRACACARVRGSGGRRGARGRCGSCGGRCECGARDRRGCYGAGSHGARKGRRFCWAGNFRRGHRASRRHIRGNLRRAGRALGHVEGRDGLKDRKRQRLRGRRNHTRPDVLYHR